MTRGSIPSTRELLVAKPTGIHGIGHRAQHAERHVDENSDHDGDDQSHRVLLRLLHGVLEGREGEKGERRKWGRSQPRPENSKSHRKASRGPKACSREGAPCRSGVRTSRYRS